MQRPRGSSLLLVVALCTGLLFLTPAAGRAQTPLPDVNITLVLQIRDLAGWLNMYNEVLGTASEARKPLSVSLGAATGGKRMLLVEQPKFSVDMGLVPGASWFKVSVSGKVTGGEALRGLTMFQHAALEAQAGAVANDLTLFYGLSQVAGHLMEMYLSRP